MTEYFKGFEKTDEEIQRICREYCKIRGEDPDEVCFKTEQVPSDAHTTRFKMTPHKKWETYKEKAIEFYFLHHLIVGDLKRTNSTEPNK